MSIESRETQPTQFTSNGNGEHHVLSPKDRKRFLNNVAYSPVPDVDSAIEILPRVEQLYKDLGVPRSDRRKITQILETKLYGGTAKEQVEASESLLSLNNTYEALRDTPKRERER